MFRMPGSSSTTKTLRDSLVFICVFNTACTFIVRYGFLFAFVSCADREPDLKFRPARTAFHGNECGMLHDNLMNKREPEACSQTLRLSGVERLKNMWKDFFGDTGARVNHPQIDP